MDLDETDICPALDFMAISLYSQQAGQKAVSESSPKQEGYLQQSKGDEMGSPPEEQVNSQAILPVSFLETTFGQAEGRKA